jgi:hypothetical protein
VQRRGGELHEYGKADDHCENHHGEQDHDSSKLDPEWPARNRVSSSWPDVDPYRRPSAKPAVPRCRGALTGQPGGRSGRPSTPDQDTRRTARVRGVRDGQPGLLIMRYRRRPDWARSLRGVARETRDDWQVLTQGRCRIAATIMTAPSPIRTTGQTCSQSMWSQTFANPAIPIRTSNVPRTSGV